jgi:glycosyltransferase involved in cell wall biosynthesis
MSPLKLTVSVADQRFDNAKSLGIFNASLGLCRALAQRTELASLTLLTNDSWPVDPSGWGRAHLKLCADQNSGRAWRMWWDQVGLYRAARKTGNDWLLLPKGYASFLQRSPVNLVPYIHDGMNEYYREHYRHGLPPLENLYFLAAQRAAIQQARVILTNTAFSATEICRIAKRHHLKTPNVNVVGIGFERPAATAAVARTRILVLASRFPHKRTDLAMDYLVRWQKQTQYGGPVDWIGQLPKALAFPTFANWHLHQRLPPKEYNGLMSEAQALIYFSDYEGFGMPPVEAMLAGACPVYSDLPPTREVMQNMGYSFANSDYAAFATALDQALVTPPEQVQQWADKLLTLHNWQQVAERTIQALK